MFFSGITSFFGALFGIWHASIGLIRYGRNPLKYSDRIKCCVRQSYDLELFDTTSSESIRESMRLAGDPNDPLGRPGVRFAPSEFEGVWWMDGNPAAEVLATMGDAFFTPGHENGDLFKLPTLDIQGGTFSYRNTWRGRGLFIRHCTLTVQPTFVMDTEHTRLLYQGGARVEGERMYYENEHTYSKPVLDGAYRYTLRCIIDANGNETLNWPIWLERVGKRHKERSLVTYRRRDGGIKTCGFGVL